MENNVLILVLKNDWVVLFFGNIYIGKYIVGWFYLIDVFIVVYMKLIYGIEIFDLWVSSSFINILDIDICRVMYMEGCDMLLKDIMNEICNVVKFLFDKLKIYCNGECIVKIEVMEE